MENERADSSEHVKPDFGSSGYFCIELFCGSGNLTFAMKHFFPDSFGVDHKVAKQRVKVICLDLTRKDHQALAIDCMGYFRNMLVGAFRSALWNSIEGTLQTYEQNTPWSSTSSQCSLAGWPTWSLWCQFGQAACSQQALSVHVRAHSDFGSTAHHVDC